MPKNCVTCGNRVHPVRVDLGFDECKACGMGTVMHAGYPLVNGKCGVSVQIMPGKMKSLHRTYEKQIHRHRWAG